MNSVASTMNQHQGNTHIIDFIVNSVALTMNQHQGNTHMIDSTTNNFVFTVNQHQGNTDIIDFTMISVVFTKSQHQGNTHIIDFTINSVAFTMNQHQGNTNIIYFAMNSVAFARPSAVGLPCEPGGLLAISGSVFWVLPGPPGFLCFRWLSRSVTKFLKKRFFYMLICQTLLPGGAPYLGISRGLRFGHRGGYTTRC